MLHIRALWEGKIDFGSALSLAAYMGSQSIVDLLLDNGADIDQQGGCFDSPLFAAVRRDMVAIAQRLLEGGAGCNLMSEHWGTPLHCACRSKQQPLIRLLLRHGADPNVKDLKGVTPLTLIIDKNGNGPPEPHFFLFLEEAKGVQITQDDLFAAARQGDMLRNLLQIDQGIFLSERVICEALKKDSVHYESKMPGILRRAGSIGATAEMVKSVRMATTLEFMLQNLSPVCPITAELLESETKLDKIDVLLWYDEHVVPTERVVLNALHDHKTYHDLVNP